MLVRLDSAYDAIETRVLLRKAEKVSFIIKWNPRREDTSKLCKRAFSEGKVTEPRPGKSHFHFLSKAFELGRGNVLK